MTKNVKMTLHLIESHEQFKLTDIVGPLKYKVIKVTQRSAVHYDLECVLDHNDENSAEIVIVGPIAELNYAKRAYWDNRWWKDTVSSAVRLIDAMSGIKKNDMEELSKSLRVKT